MEEAQENTDLSRMYRDSEGTWRGSDGVIEVIMTNQAFIRHTTAYLKTNGILQPNGEQLRAAQRAVMQCGYWHTSIGIEDSDVHVRAARKRESDDTK